MSWQEVRLTGVVKRHDPKLFVKKNYKGVMQVLREHFATTKYDVDGHCLIAITPAPYYVMALTDNWSPNGNPVDWGVDPILHRLLAIDSWNTNSFVNSEMDKQNEKVDRSKDNDLLNKCESAAYEMRDSFKKTFSDVNTTNMKKINKRSKKGA